MGGIYVSTAIYKPSSARLLSLDKEKSEMKVLARFVVACMLLHICGGTKFEIRHQKENNSSRHDLVLPSRNNSSVSIHHRVRRAAVADRNRLWDKATIPYDIDPILSDFANTILMLSMHEWEKATCLSFVKKTPSDVHFVHFTRTNCGCCTPVGNQRNGSQFFSISPNCSKMGNIMHELGHTIGFYHEQSRPDRDKHVRVHFENIGKDLHHNFKIYKNLDTLGEPYDFDSIMHYPLIDTMNEGKVLMSVIDNTSRHSYTRVGQRSVLSSGDIKQANKLYRCPECGKTLTKSSGMLDFQGEIMETKNKFKKFFKKQNCQWRIIASSSDIIELKITRARIPKNKNCSSYMEIRNGYYNSEVLEKICGRVIRKPMVIKSKGPRMFIEFNLAPGGRMLTPGWKAQYRTLSLTTLKGQSGNFTSPGFPDFYPFLKLNHYLLISRMCGTIIKLTFHIVEIGEDPQCAEEYLEIRDGENEEAKALGRICGKKQNLSYTSSSNILLVVFKSFTSTDLKGFTASYVTVTKKKKNDKNIKNDKKKKKNL